MSNDARRDAARIYRETTGGSVAGIFMVGLEDPKCGWGESLVDARHVLVGMLEGAFTRGWLDALAQPADDDGPAEAAAAVPELPEGRLFFRIGDVAEICGVEDYVLRYWETEFPLLSPRRAANGQREYRRRDIALALTIKSLLYEDRYTIAGARKALRAGVKKRRVKLTCDVGAITTAVVQSGAVTEKDMSIQEESK